ncbi:Flp1 family type IVb pilin [Paenibacillus sp. SN-8-1]|uniref:Flp1 family type IVb pilin n=1 Tax=Paenibacillus sp. SN-8-1 TaxID=3435409 RepID=UPI003D9A67F7
MLTTIQGRMKQLWKDEKGLGMLEIILIIAVIVIIAVIFREQLSNIVRNLLSKAGSKTDEFMDGK